MVGYFYVYFEFLGILANLSDTQVLEQIKNEPFLGNIFYGVICSKLIS